MSSKLPEQHQLTISKTARYHVWGNSINPKTVWFVLHGYGQLSTFFIRKFNSLNEKDHLVIAPEGLHRFYLQGSSGRVGASWMTKEERLSDIEDYVDYLDLLAQKICASFKNVQTVLLGFSQGSATACRWAYMGKTKFNHLVLWASVFPPDLRFQTNESQNIPSHHYVVYGDEDEYMSVDDFETHFKTIEAKGIALSRLPFSGGHNIYPSVLKELECSMIFV